MSEKKSSSPNHNGDAAEDSGHVPSEYFVEQIQKNDMIANDDNIVVDTNLIQLDTDDMASNTNNTYADNDDDLIFEVGNKFVYFSADMKNV